MNGIRRRMLQKASPYLFEWHWAVGDTLQKFLDFIKIGFFPNDGTNTTYSITLESNGIKHSQWGDAWRVTYLHIKNNTIPASANTVEISTSETIYGGQNTYGSQPSADQKIPSVAATPYFLYSSTNSGKLNCYNNGGWIRKDVNLVNPSDYKAVIHLDSRFVDLYMNNILLFSQPFDSGTEDDEYLLSSNQTSSPNFNWVSYIIFHSIDIVAY